LSIIPTLTQIQLLSLAAAFSLIGIQRESTWDKRPSAPGKDLNFSDD